MNIRRHMNIRIFGSILVLVLLATVMIGQADEMQKHPTSGQKWGEAACGAQLSIGLSTNVIAINEKMELSAQIRNISTNRITVIVSDALVNDFTVYLTDVSGKIRIIAKPSGAVIAVLPAIDINPGESHSWTIPVAMGTNVNAGFYAVKATRNVKTAMGDCELASNSLDVQLML